MKETLRSSGKLWPTVSLILFIGAYSMCFTTLPLMLNYIIDEFKVAGPLQGVIISMVNVGSFAVVLTMPFLQGRVKKTLMMTICGIMQTAGIFLCGVSPSFFVLLAACFIIGMGDGWSDGYGNSSMVDLHRENSAKYMGILHGAFGVTALITPLMVTGLLAITSWRNTFFVVALIMLCICAFVTVVSLRHREVFGQTSNNEEKLTLARMKMFLKDKVMLLVVACTFFYCASQGGLLAWTVRFMKVEYNMEALGSLGISCYWLFSTIGRFIAPRINVIKIKLVVFGGAAAAIAHSIGVLSGNPYVMVAMCGVNGLLSGFCFPMLIYTGLTRFPGSTSAPTTMVMIANKIGHMLMPLVVGFVAAYSMKAGMMVTAFCSFMTMLTAFVILQALKKEIAQA